MKIKINKIPFLLLLIGLMLILMCNPYGFNMGVSLGTYSIALGTFFALFIYVKNNKISAQFLLHILLVAIMMLSAVINNSLNYISFIKIVTFIELPILLMCYSLIVNESTEKYIHIGMRAISIFFILLFFTDVAYKYSTKYGVVYIQDLTLGYNNPNETAMYLYGVFSLLIAEIKKPKKIVDVLDWILSIFVLILILLTRSRSCILISALNVIYCFFFSKKKVPPVFRVTIWFIPAIYLFISLMLPSFIRNISLFGETLDTGRYQIFVNAISNLTFFQYFIGDFSVGFKNLHNTYLTIFCTTGVLGLTIWLYLLVFNIEKNYKKQSINYCALISLLMIVLHSSVESAFFTSGSCYTAFVFFIFVKSFNLNKLLGK